MSGAIALARARQAGVVVTLDGDSLALSATRPPPKDVVELLKAHKLEIVELLRRRDRSDRQVDLTGPNLSPLSPRARAHGCKGEPAKVGPVRSTSAVDRLTPAGDVGLAPDAPGDEGLEWPGEAAEPFAGDRIGGEPEPEPSRPLLAPVAGSLVQRLMAAGATINTYGKLAEVRAPAGIPLELVQEVEACGWRIIPGGKPNPEAEHDSWLAGVPAAEFKDGR
jgi:hypothetical protein